LLAETSRFGRLIRTSKPGRVEDWVRRETGML
jgi:hypothetical protein